jgi:hypothetical protein
MRSPLGYPPLIGPAQSNDRRASGGGLAPTSTETDSRRRPTPAKSPSRAAAAVGNEVHIGFAERGIEAEEAARHGVPSIRCFQLGGGAIEIDNRY